MNAFNLVIGDVLTFLTVNIEDSFCNCYYYYLLITPKQFFYKHTDIQNMVKAVNIRNSTSGYLLAGFHSMM